MSTFLADKFQAAKYEPRTVTVTIEALAEFFSEGPPEFTVRGLTASELQRATEAGVRNKALDDVVKAISASKDQVSEIRRALGMSDDVPGEIAKRMEMLVLGSVTPALTHASVAKLATVCPIEFFDITNKIVALTGQGGSRVKPQPSSETTPQ